MSIAERIYEHVSTMPEPAAREVLDFVEFLKHRLARQAAPPPVPAGEDLRAGTWFASVWGSSPDFPERLPDPLPEPVEML